MANKKHQSENTVEYSFEDLIAHATHLFGVPRYVAVAAHKAAGRPERLTKAAMQQAITSYMNREVK